MTVLYYGVELPLFFPAARYSMLFSIDGEDRASEGLPNEEEEKESESQSGNRSGVSRVLTETRPRGVCAGIEYIQ